MKLFRYQAIDWDKPLETASPGTAPPKELVEKAKKTGSRRKKIVAGDAGFFMNRSYLAPGFRVPTHHHGHDEMLIILRGGCTFDPPKDSDVNPEDILGEVGPDDTVVILANQRYGFVCGPEGMEFLTIRIGESTTSL